DSGDGSLHYAVLGISLSLDTTNEDYATFGDGAGDLSAQDNIINDTIKTVIASHTIDDMRNNEEEVKEEILEALQGLFKSAFIVRVNFSSATYQ
ncbi:MAG: flagellar basal body-associated FliL family protein, partial [Pseudobutyrivibrio sp.]|nr:flagellar basal body-associated FliL family protein [Pseudobutyrivibrio sp.]